MSELRDNNLFDCSLTPGVLAIIVVVVVVSVLLAYLIATACVRAWIRKSPTLVQFLVLFISALVFLDSISMVITHFNVSTIFRP